MSLADTRARAGAAAPRKSTSKRGCGIAVPGLPADAIAQLEANFPGTLTPELRRWLQRSAGLEDTALGSIDFTGQLHAEEPLRVCHPCLTLAIDAAGRRWIAETAALRGLPGPVWCVFRTLPVALHVSDHLATFIGTLEERTQAGCTREWLQALEGIAQTLWENRYLLAVRSRKLCEADGAVRGWLAELPPGAYIYDLRTPLSGRGWPYGVAGHCAKFYRCGQLPIFAIAPEHPAE